MQKPAVDNKPPRFYHILIHEDMLHGCTLITETGYQGSKGRVKKQLFKDRESAERVMMDIRDTQIKHGYRVMIVQGQDCPS